MQIVIVMIKQQFSVQTFRLTMIKGFSDVIDFFLHLLQRLSDKCSAQQWKSWEQRHPSQYGSQSLRL